MAADAPGRALGCPRADPEQKQYGGAQRRELLLVDLKPSRRYSCLLRPRAISNKRMETVGEDEPDPIKLKSIKNNTTFTVPQNDRVRHSAAWSAYRGK